LREVAVVGLALAEKFFLLRFALGESSSFTEPSDVCFELSRGGFSESVGLRKCRGQFYGPRLAQRQAICIRFLEEQRLHVGAALAVDDLAEGPVAVR